MASYFETPSIWIQLNPNTIKAFRGLLLRLSSEHTQVRGHITLEKTCNVGSDSKEVEVNYLIIDALSPYNIILGRPTTNSFRAIISTEYLVLKYP